MPGLTAGEQELDADTPWVKVDWKIYHDQSEMASIPLKRISGTHRLSPCSMIVMKSQMILLRTTLPRPDTPPEPNETGEKEEITTWLTEGVVKKDAMARMDDTRS